MSEQKKVDLNYDYVINILSKQVEQLSREKAVIHAQYIQEQERNQALVEQLAKLQKKK